MRKIVALAVVLLLSRRSAQVARGSSTDRPRRTVYDGRPRAARAVSDRGDQVTRRKPISRRAKTSYRAAAVAPGFINMLSW